MLDMIETRTVMVASQFIVAKVCDRCRRRAVPGDSDFEAEEFVSIRHNGGYGSVFGDGIRFEIDLCQHCVSELLGGFGRIVHTGVKA